MPDFRIFTESKADVRFIRDYVLEVFGKELSEVSDFDTLKGHSGYKEGGTLIKSIRQNSDNDKRTILILDADVNIEERRATVLKDFAEYDVPVSLFLFPDNNSSGALENLLCAVAIETNILRCFENYEACISDYQSPEIKSKVFAYLDALLPAANKKNNSIDLIQEKNRNYRNPDHWNLHHEYLQPLHNFLFPFFIQP